MGKNNIILFLGFCIILFLVVFYSQTFFFTYDFYRYITESQMTESQFEDYQSFLRKWQWISYFFIPLSLILKISFSWFCLKSGSFLTDNFNDVSFWNICFRAELIFIVGAVAGLLYIEFFVDFETLEQLAIKPFSLYGLITNSVPNWSAYFFNTLNIFEFIYVLYLAYLIMEESKKAFLPSLKFVATTYLPGLLIWVLVVSYLSVVFQP